MRRAVFIVGLLALVATACADADTGSSLAPVTFGATSTTLEPTTSIVGSSTSTTVFVPPTSSFLGPTVTYDPATPRYGGEVLIGDDQTPPTLNPYAPGGDNFIVWLVGQAHLARAFDVDPETLQLIPDAIEEIPTIANGSVVLNPDSTMDVTWRLRPAAQWADGFAMTGADLEFTLEFQQAGLECAGREFVSDPPPTGQVIEVGDESLTLRFESPTLDYETLLQWIVPRHQVEGSDYCEDWNTKPWVSGGPFTFVEWDRAGQSISFERNHNYWKFGDTGDKLPYLDSVKFLFEPETENLARMFTNRNLDVINPPPFVGSPERCR